MFERDTRADNADRADENPAGGNGGTREGMGEGMGEDMAEVGLETPDVDAAEQQALVGEEPLSQGFRRTAFDVNEADAADQDRVVELDEDDYR